MWNLSWCDRWQMESACLSGHSSHIFPCSSFSLGSLFRKTLATTVQANPYSLFYHSLPSKGQNPTSPCISNTWWILFSPVYNTKPRAFYVLHDTRKQRALDRSRLAWLGCLANMPNGQTTCSSASGAAVLVDRVSNLTHLYLEGPVATTHTHVSIIINSDGLFLIKDLKMEIYLTCLMLTTGSLERIKKWHPFKVGVSLMLTCPLTTGGFNHATFLRGQLPWAPNSKLFSVVMQLRILEKTTGLPFSLLSSISILVQGQGVKMGWYSTTLGLVCAAALAGQCLLYPPRSSISRVTTFLPEVCSTLFPRWTSPHP